MISDAVARAWYHDNRPGGLPRDWIDDGAGSGSVQRLAVIATAALLSVSGRLHVDDSDRGCTYRECVFCTAPAKVIPEEERHA